MIIPSRHTLSECPGNFEEVMCVCVNFAALWMRFPRVLNLLLKCWHLNLNYSSGIISDSSVCSQRRTRISYWCWSSGWSCWLYQPFRLRGHIIPCSLTMTHLIFLDSSLVSAEAFGSLLRWFLWSFELWLMFCCSDRIWFLMFHNFLNMAHWKLFVSSGICISSVIPEQMFCT